MLQALSEVKFQLIFDKYPAYPLHMHVSDSELLSALIIQRLNHRMSFMFISNHRQLKQMSVLFFVVFYAKIAISGYTRHSI